jgi:hypothetical protein
MEVNLSQISESPVNCTVSRVGASVPLTCTQQRIFFVHMGNAPNLLYLFHDTLSTADATFRRVSGMTKGAGTVSLLLKLLLYRRNGSIR